MCLYSSARDKFATKQSYKITIALMLVGLTIFAHPAGAQVRPILPLNATPQQCSSFRESFKIYIDSLRDEHYACIRNSRSVPVSQWRPGFRCANDDKVRVPPACVSTSDNWKCALEEFGAVMKTCLYAPPTPTEQQESIRLDNSLDKALRDTTTGVPGVSKDMAVSLAKWWVDRNNAELSALIAAGQHSVNYTQTAVSIQNIFSSLRDPVSRTQELVLLFNKLGYGASREMTKLAIRGAAKTNSEAVKVLMESLEKFSSDLDTAVTDARRPRASEETDGNSPRACSSFSWYQSCMRDEKHCVASTGQDVLQTCCLRNQIEFLRRQGETCAP